MSQYHRDTIEMLKKMDHKALVYIAAPYTAKLADGSEDKVTVANRVRTVSLCMEKFMQMGIKTCSPILMHLLRTYVNELPGDWAYWGEYSEIMMERCDYMIVLEIDGFLESTGVNAEREYMSINGKQIFFIKPEELLAEEPPAVVAAPAIAERPVLGDEVIAIRDGHTFKKGATGRLVRQGAIDSENYYIIDLENGQQIGPSLEDYWAKHVKE